MLWLSCPKHSLAALGLPQRRRRVFIFASLYCNVRDVLLAQGSGECLGVCRLMFGAQRPCYHCVRAFGGPPVLSLEDSAADGTVEVDLEALAPGSPSRGNAWQQEEVPWPSDPQCFTLALDIGEARWVVACILGRTWQDLEVRMT